MVKDEFKKAHFHTWEHIHEVRVRIQKIQKILAQRALKHDRTKMLDDIEAAIFAEAGEKFADIKYGSKEYTENLERIKPAIEQHHRANRHHPEFHKEGINGMNLVDIVEMFCDWDAAVKRNKEGNIYESLRIQKERFDISDQLYNIMRNSIELLED